MEFKLKKFKKTYGIGVSYLFILMLILDVVLLCFNLIYLSSLILFVIVSLALFKRLEDCNYKDPIDSIDDYFFKKTDDDIEKYIGKKFLFYCFLHLLINVILILTSDSSDFMRILYLECLNFLGSIYIGDSLFNFFMPYDFSSKYLFSSNLGYLLRIWNFLYFRKKVYNHKKSMSTFKIWKENIQLSKSNQSKFIQEELRTLNSVFLKELDSFLRFPQNPRETPLLSISFIGSSFEYYFSLLFPFMIGFIFGDASDQNSLSFIIYFSAVLFIIFIMIKAISNWIGNINLINQLEIILPNLLHEELENRRNLKRVRRPHRYKKNCL